MTKKSDPESKKPERTPEKTFKILRQQLAELQKIKAMPPLEAYKEKEVWAQVTGGIIARGFGEPSRQLTAFHFGHYAARNKSQLEDFRAVTEAHETSVNSAIKELEFMLPEADLKSTYDSGDEFAFYVDLKGILMSANRDVLVVDNYLNAEFFELYAIPISKGVALRIVTDEIRGNVEAVAKKYAP